MKKRGAAFMKHKGGGLYLQPNTLILDLLLTVHAQINYISQ